MPSRSEIDRSELSIIPLATTLVRERRVLSRWILLGGLLAVAFVFARPRQYRTTVSFHPQGQDAGQSGLASLAGQFGVSIPGSSNAPSPDFYASLTRSRVILSAIARDSVRGPDDQGRMISILDVLEIPEGAPGRRVEKAVKRLRRITGVSVQKATGLVEVSVLTRWPTVSAAIATRLLDGVNDFNVRSAQLQASAERSFIEERLSVAQRDLRAAEDRLEGFLRANRQFEGAPALAFQRDRLQRSVVLQQEVFTTLTKSHEEVRMREVRATPVITVVDGPEVPVLPESRQGLALLLIGCTLFGTVGSLKILEGQRRRQAANDPSDHLGQLLTEVRSAITDVAPFSRRRRHDASE